MNTWGSSGLQRAETDDVISHRSDLTNSDITWWHRSNENSFSSLTAVVLFFSATRLLLCSLLSSLMSWTRRQHAIILLLLLLHSVLILPMNWYPPPTCEWQTLHPSDSTAAEQQQGQVSPESTNKQVEQHLSHLSLLSSPPASSGSERRWPGDEAGDLQHVGGSQRISEALGGFWRISFWCSSDNADCWAGDYFSLSMDL